MMKFVFFLIALAFPISVFVLRNVLFSIGRKRRRDYYRNEYLHSEAWDRKRYVVLKRDNWRCVHCGARATQVHHRKYARNIGREPIEWLESVCDSCHENIHQH